MNKLFAFVLLLLLAPIAMGQSLDSPLSKKKMRKDLETFKNIRLEANSGLYKYRTKAQIDSTWDWATQEIERSQTYRDFYKIICQITDFEGSTHNSTGLSKRVAQSRKSETHGYFPFSIKVLGGKVLVNSEQARIPLGAEIVAINGMQMTSVISSLYKYYTTDGKNTSGKTIGINYAFPLYFRYQYGLQDSFAIAYRAHGAVGLEKSTLSGVGYAGFAKSIKGRFSAPFDEGYYKDWETEEMYTFEELNDSVARLTINSFAIGGNAEAEEHLAYVAFLDSVFGKMKTEQTRHLVLDIRNNGGGSDPNDLVTYSYLTDRNFSENTEAFVSFWKVPYVRLIQAGIPFFLKPFAKMIYKKRLKKEFPVQKMGHFYQDSSSNDHKVRTPNENAFSGRVYMLVGPRIASAGSLFAAMAAGDEQTTVIGEETMGGYYGHNGHTHVPFRLPKTKIETSIFLVNLEQDVLPRENQPRGRGVMPDFEVIQSHDDFLNHVDTQMNFTLGLIQNGKTK